MYSTNTSHGSTSCPNSVEAGHKNCPNYEQLDKKETTNWIPKWQLLPLVWLFQIQWQNLLTSETLSAWPGALPLDHAGGSAPDSHYRLALRARHSCPPLIFSARCNIYISRLCYDVGVRLSVTEVHWHIIANLGFKFWSTFTEHCGHGAWREEGRGFVCIWTMLTFIWFYNLMHYIWRMVCARASHISRYASLC